MTHTPIELYDGIYVKREDLCFQPPAPPFSKCRGIIKHLELLKLQGITTVGYVETSISMAGWGIAWACQLLDMQAIIFDPQYKETPPTLAYHREQWVKFPATKIIPIKAGMAKVNWYICRQLIKEYPNSILLPLGLPFKETIEETCKEVQETLKVSKIGFKTIVCCVGSGTICAGIWKGLDVLQKANILLIGVMTRTGSVEAKKGVIEKKADMSNNGIFRSMVKLALYDSGYEYTQECKVEVPFPCHSFYDAKAWAWILENRMYLKEPIMFWNIGH